MLPEEKMHRLRCFMGWQVEILVGFILSWCLLFGIMAVGVRGLSLPSFFAFVAALSFLSGAVYDVLARPRQMPLFLWGCGFMLFCSAIAHGRFTHALLLFVLFIEIAAHVGWLITNRYRRRSLPRG